MINAKGYGCNFTTCDWTHELLVFSALIYNIAHKEPMKGYIDS